LIKNSLKFNFQQVCLSILGQALFKNRGQFFAMKPYLAQVRHFRFTPLFFGQKMAVALIGVRPFEEKCDELFGLLFKA
jgi:hypothetical protein